MFPQARAAIANGGKKVLKDPKIDLKTSHDHQASQTDTIATQAGALVNILLHF